MVVIVTLTEVRQVFNMSDHNVVRCLLFAGFSVVLHRAIC